MRHALSRLLPPFALFALSACATARADYPSLAIRNEERAEGTFAVGESKRLDVPPVEAGATADVAALLATARTAHARFTQLAPEARRRVGAAGARATASDAWGAAQVAVAELEAARSEVAILLGDLDALYIAQAVQAEANAELTAARDQVLGWIAEEDVVLAELGARLGG